MFYELNYNSMNGFEGYDNYLIIPVEMEMPNLNAFNNNNYYRDVFNLALLDINSFKVKKLFGNWSKIYKSNRNYPFLTNNSYSFKKDGNIIINYEADTLLYEIDSNLKPVKQFGFKPLNFNNKYKSTVKLSDAFNENLAKDFKNRFGFFGEVLSNKSDVLRTFYTGVYNSKKDSNYGVQIYRNYNLVSEIYLPKKLKLLGYISPFYYFYDEEFAKESNIFIYKLII